jgi:H+/Cl- antiporter ClcA
MKWIGVIILVIIGILAAIVAIEYLTVSIHSLPSWIPGHKTGHYKGRGHYHKRGAVAAVIALAAFVAAGYWAYRITRAGRPAVVAAGPSPAPDSSAEQLLSNPTPTDGDTEAK